MTRPVKSVATMIVRKQPEGVTRWRFARDPVRLFGGTIRGRILVAFLTSSLITAALGAYAVASLRETGDLVNKTFDRSLMSINYARAAATDFAGIQVALARRRLAVSEDDIRDLDAKIDELVRTFDEDISIAAERAQSKRAEREAAAVKEAVGDWLKARRAVNQSAEAETVWKVLDGHAETAEQHLDLLINFTAGDGFSYRQTARALVEQNMSVSVVATLVAILLTGAVSWLLARRIIRPVADASMVARRIASGDLSVAIPDGGADELGALLRAMTAMRSNIRAMVESEASQRRSAQGLLADAVQSLSEAVLVVDAQGRIILANARAAALLGGVDLSQSVCRLADVEGSPIADALLALPGRGTSIETHLVDGRWLSVSSSTTRDGGFVAVCSDISLLKDQETRLKQINLRLDAALDNMSQGLCLYDAENRLLVSNRRFRDIFGIEAAALPAGLAFLDVLAIVSRASRFQDARAHDLLSEQAAILARGGSGSLCQAIRSGCMVSVDQQRTADGGWIATYEDVTERYEAEARIVTMARRDALTGLANRMVFGERLEEAVGQLARGEGFAVLCLDLDRFKDVNDTLGHPVGDGLLREVASRLQACVRDGDMVARLGGDEFAIVQLGVKRRDDAVALARRITDAMLEPFFIDAHNVSVGVSVGICLAPEHGSDPDALLKNADLALYRAKSRGRGAWMCFESEMDLELQNRRALETDLRQAMANREFELAYQPIYDIGRNAIVSCEALLRWRHPRRGMVSPAEFVPLAEEIGIIGEIGEWVLHQACREASTWPSGIGVAVNVSAVQFRNAALVRTVMGALAESRMPAPRLELEITESVLLTNNLATLATLHTIKRLGVRIAMDDFGTGYSSLSYLQSFPFDKIKIDQSFIRDLDTAPNSGLIIRSVINLGKSLGMCTTAEGIETQAQLERLRQEGCDQAQGYLFSRPVPSLEIRRLCAAPVGSAA